MNEQDLNQKFQAYEGQIRQLQEQLKAVEQATIDMVTISSGLDDLIGKEGEEILAPIGRGILVKAKLLSEQLVVEIGEGTFIEKSIPDTKKLIATQSEKMKGAQTQIEDELEKINQEITETMREYQEYMQSKAA
ncbi:MAG: prefoldin subunit alpha [Nanoarchaeota archaeon]|jgi:prefoldin alpha subunit|nr:prefoldin subunit alpha [Nanoarchaeota archaeon]